MQVILQKLDEHDKRFDEHDKRFDEHDKRFDEHDKRFDQIDKRFDEHDKRFDEHDKRFDRIDGQIDFLAKKTLEHDDRLERIEVNMVTKNDLNGITNTLDRLVGLAEKKDQELTLIAHGLRDVENKVEEHDRDINNIKLAFGLN